MGRQYRFLTALGTTVAVVGFGVGGLAGTGHALISTNQPTLRLNRLIRTTPFVGSTVSVRDNEGSAYVAPDNALWLADDNGDAIREIDRTTGVLRRTIAQSTFNAVRQLGGSNTAGSARTEDLEAIAYDANADVMYAFSGSTGATPTVFRLVRNSSNQLALDAWQPLASEWTGAGWRLADGKLYAVIGSTLRTYDFASNSFGTAFSISGLTNMFGIDFDDATGDLVAVNNAQKVFRASMTTRTLLPGWGGIDLTGFGIRDSRAVEVIGDQLFVTDGLDTRSSSDPMNHAVFVLDVTGPTSTPAPIAAFTATPTSGTAPVSVGFTDTSTGAPTSWAWTFGDGGTSTSQNPSHTYTTAGTFTATLTASNGGGSTSASRTISVTAAPVAPTAAFTATPTTGTAPLAVSFTDTSTGAPTSWSWAFGDGATSTAQNPTHTYGANGGYSATLTATNAQGSTTASRTITVSDAPPPPTTVALDADSYFNTSSPTKNYGAYTVMKLHSPTTAEYRPIVKFTLSGLAGAPTSVKLRLFVTDASSNGGSWYKVDNGWTETGVNWDNKPVVSGSPAAVVGSSPLGTWIEVDVTSAITGNGTYSFEATSPSTDTAAFSSREGTNPPQVVIAP